MKEINDDNFNKEVIYNNKLPFLLFFHTKSCKYCPIMEKILLIFENEYKDKILFFSILVDENEKIRDNYMIKASPTTFIFDNNKNLIKRIYGSSFNYDEIKSIFNKIIIKEEYKKEKSFLNFLKKDFL